MNLDEHHMIYTDDLIRNTAAVFQLLGGKNRVFQSWRIAHEHMSKETLETNFRLLGGKLRISIEFDQTNITRGNKHDLL